MASNFKAVNTKLDTKFDKLQDSISLLFSGLQSAGVIKETPKQDQETALQETRGRKAPRDDNENPDADGDVQIIDSDDQGTPASKKQHLQSDPRSAVGAAGTEEVWA